MGASYIQTWGGHSVDFFKVLDGEDFAVDLEDIAHGLAAVQRFGGQGHHWTVEDHTLLGLRILRNLFRVETKAYRLPDSCPAVFVVGSTEAERAEAALRWLLHDAHEAYVGDLVAPLKALFRAHTDVYDRLVAELDRQIFGHFGLKPEAPRHMRDLLKWVDTQACLHAEAAHVFRGRPICDRPWVDAELALFGWGYGHPVPPCQVSPDWLSGVRQAARSCYRQVPGVFPID